MIELSEINLLSAITRMEYAVIVLVIHVRDFSRGVDWN